MSLRRSQVLALTSCNICHCKSQKADQRKYYAEVITVIHKKNGRLWFTGNKANRFPLSQRLR